MQEHDWRGAAIAIAIATGTTILLIAAIAKLSGDLRLNVLTLGVIAGVIAVALVLVIWLATRQTA